jgi:hypothetical protein
VREMMDFQMWKLRREDVMRQAEQSRLARALRGSRRRRGPGRASGIAWELERMAGRLRKLSRILR